MKIAIQGIKGSYHHEVTENIYGDTTELLECDNFAEIPPLVIDKTADKAVMAIENSIAGAIIPNYALINEYNLQICGEYFLPIQHQLMALKGENIETIREVRSHPMALEQCRRFFRDYPHIKLIEEKDTAQVAKEIQEKQIRGIAAIASRTAAKIYDLDIIASDIQTNKDNYTRFVILSKKNGFIPDSYNKASIKFVLNHRAGSLLETLQIFKDNNINMSKIQSIPIIDKPWEYAFFADLLFDSIDDFQKTKTALLNHVNELKILGKYTKFEKNDKSNSK